MIGLGVWAPVGATVIAVGLFAYAWRVPEPDGEERSFYAALWTIMTFGVWLGWVFS